MATTAISDFFETLRFMLEDQDATVQKYPDAQLATAVRTTLRTRQVPAYSVAPDVSQITPEVTDPNDWALIALHTVRNYVRREPDRSSWGVRAYKESHGSWQKYLDALDRDIHKLANGAMFSGWYNYYTWLQGMSGLPLNLVLARLNVRAPFYTVNLSTDGVVTNEP